MLVFTHGNKEATGARLTADIMPADPEGGKQGFAILSIYPQIGASKSGASHIFDADGGIHVALSARNLAHLLLVLDGKAASILGDKGLRLKRGYDSERGAVLDGDKITTILHCDKVMAPFEGFAFHAKSIAQGDNEVWYWNDRRILLNLAEGAALRDALRASMGRIAFGK